MKIALTIILALYLSVNTFAQHRRAIIKQIDRFRNAELYNATFDIELDSLKNILSQYFIQQNYKKMSESDSMMRFYIRKNVAGVRRGEPHAFANNRRGRYTICGIRVDVSVLITNVEGKKKVFVSSAAVNYTINASTNIYTLGGSHRFDELSLRTFLYIKCLGSSIQMPPELYAMVNDYNFNQTKERKKLIQGRHY